MRRLGPKKLARLQRIVGSRYEVHHALADSHHGAASVFVVDREAWDDAPQHKVLLVNYVTGETVTWKAGPLSTWI